MRVWQRGQRYFGGLMWLSMDQLAGCSLRWSWLAGEMETDQIVHKSERRASSGGWDILGV